MEPHSWGTNTNLPNPQDPQELLLPYLVTLSGFLPVLWISSCFVAVVLAQPRGEGAFPLHRTSQTFPGGNSSLNYSFLGMIYL